MVRTETGSSNDGSTIAGQMDLVRVNFSPANGFLQKAGAKDLEQNAISFVTDTEDNAGKAGNQLLNGFLFDWIGLLAFDFRFLHSFSCWWFQVRREVI